MCSDCLGVYWRTAFIRNPAFIRSFTVIDIINQICCNNCESIDGLQLHDSDIFVHGML